MKSKALLALLLSIVMLSGCSAPKNEINETQTTADLALTTGVVENVVSISPPDFSTEAGISKYLAGEWTFNNEYVSDVVCTMRIDADLKVYLSFSDTETEESKGEYNGQIKFDRLYAQPNEVPDLVSIELTDTDYPGGDFFFQHRTDYDGKRVMSWFFAGNGNCIFDKLGSGEFEYAPAEVIFKKVSEGVTQLSPRQNEWFYAIYWGKGTSSLWLDDAVWTPPEDNDDENLYPREMVLYENDVKESVLYTIAPDKVSDILGEDLFPGQVYYAETDEQGNVIEFMSAEYKEYLHNNPGAALDCKTEELIFDIIQGETQEYLDMGMAILYTDETIMLDDADCYLVELGTNHEDQFVREFHYAVNTTTEQVYLYDVIMDTWEELP